MCAFATPAGWSGGGGLLLLAKPSSWPGGKVVVAWHGSGEESTTAQGGNSRSAFDQPHDA